MTVYSRTNPYVTKLLSRQRLNKSGSTKETWHVVVGVSGSLITYRPGDSFGICPENDHETVHAIIRCCGFSGDEAIVDPRSQETLSIATWLTKRANLAVATKKFLQELVKRKAIHIETLLSVDHEEKLKEFLASFTVLEILQMHPEASLQPQELASTLGPLLPRLYSIASAQNVVGDEVHFTVSRVRYELHGKKRLGVCSHFLCDMIKEKEHDVPIYLQSTKDFLLPEDNQTPMVMIGPGTGVAPFRAFMQERLSRANCTKKNWLFFGERHRECDYFYEDFWQEQASSGMLKLDLAFSRDQAEKVYVQHKMWQAKKELWSWLQDGARIYVCGDAEHMAKDVDKCLLEIIKDEANLSEESARHFLTDLRRQKRYLRDIY